jgi:serine/threonine-protein kinase
MIGARLGNWIIDVEIGRGGMGRVYLAHEQLDGGDAAAARRAAVKVLPPELAREGNLLIRFQREIEALRQLRHANIVQFYETGQYQESHYYVMEYVEGKDFDELMRERGRIPWPEVADWAAQICLALKHAHDHGIIHRDLKPANLLVTAAGVVKLTDFGIAKLFATSPVTIANTVIGTAEYMSPEQASGKPVTRRSDLYSLGVVVYTLITGGTPFQANSVPEMLHKHRYARFDLPQHFAPELPPEFSALICQLLEKEPDKRPADAFVVHRQLEALRRKRTAPEKQNLPDRSEGQTLSEPSQDTDAEVLEPGMGPATLMSKLMRAELEEMNRPGLLGRLLDRTWLLVPLFCLSLGLLIWAVWPRSAEELLRDATRAVAENDTEKAGELLVKLERKYPDHGQAAAIADLRHRIEQIERDRQARRRGPVSPPPTAPLTPPGDAQFFFLEGWQAARQGDRETARKKWRLVVDGFKGIASQAYWVQQAEAALDNDQVFVPVEEAIQKAREEKSPQRLKALVELYRSRNDPFDRPVLERLEKEIQALEAAGNGA